MTAAASLAVGNSNETLAALRSQTAELHRQLDSRVSEKAILTEDGYARFLTMHARIIPTVEEWLRGRSEFDAIPDAASRSRASELSLDLQMLGRSMPEASNMSFLNENTSVAGMCYVLEGSRLGAAYLTSLIVRTNSSYPLNFLRQGEGKPLWKSFVGWLSSRELSPMELASATRTAENMFVAYLAALD